MVALENIDAEIDQYAPMVDFATEDGKKLMEDYSQATDSET